MRLFLVCLIVLSSASLSYASEVRLNVGKEIDPAGLTEEFMSAFPTSGMNSIIYDKAKGEVVVGFSQNEPPSGDIQAVIDSHDHLKGKKERDKVNKDILKKLKGLGFTEEEAETLSR